VKMTPVGLVSPTSAPPPRTRIWGADLPIWGQSTNLQERRLFPTFVRALDTQRNQVSPESYIGVGRVSHPLGPATCRWGSGRFPCWSNSCASICVWNGLFDCLRSQALHQMQTVAPTFEVNEPVVCTSPYALCKVIRRWAAIQADGPAALSRLCQHNQWGRHMLGFLEVEGGK
jgi:hypothetical protein